MRHADKRQAKPMETLPLDVYSTRPNMAIVRAPGRKFPGMVIQGDSLHILWDCAKCVSDRLRQLKIDDAELLGEVESLLEDLEERLSHYENVLAENGIDLPYTKR